MEAFKIALGIFNELRTGRERPDHVTFGNMLRSAALLPEGDQRNSMISSTFRLCCRHGFVNSYVIRDLQYSATEELWRSLTRCPSGDVDVELLPPSWKKKFDRRKSRK
jgi:hypothetical protein